MNSYMRSKLLFKNGLTLKRLCNFEKRNSEVFKNIQDWWDPNGNMKTLHSFNTFRIEYIRSILNKLPLKEKNCLDIGCGGGLLTESLARLEANVIGIDPNETSFQIASNHLEIYQGHEKDILKYEIQI